MFDGKAASFFFFHDALRSQSPALISLMVYVDVKHHVYLLTYVHRNHKAYLGAGEWRWGKGREGGKFLMP